MDMKVVHSDLTKTHAFYLREYNSCKALVRLKESALHQNLLARFKYKLDEAKKHLDDVKSLLDS